MNKTTLAAAVAVSTFVFAGCYVESDTDPSNIDRLEDEVADVEQGITNDKVPAASDMVEVVSNDIDDHDDAVSEDDQLEPGQNEENVPQLDYGNFECRENACGPVCCTAVQRCEVTIIQPVPGAKPTTRHRCVSQ